MYTWLSIFRDFQEKPLPCQQEVEFAVGPFGVSALRESVCDFSQPLYSENNAILMVRPTLQSDMAGFIKPFSGMVRQCFDFLVDNRAEKRVIKVL